MKLYVDNYFVSSEKSNINPIQRLMMEKADSLNNQPYNKSLYELVNSPESSDYCVLPFMWNYYVDNGKLDLAKEIKDKAD